MFKKIIIILLVPSLGCAGEKTYSWVSYLNPMNYSFKGAVVKTASTNPGDYVGGYTATRVSEAVKDTKEIAELVLDPKLVGETTYEFTKGGTYGLVAGPAIAIKDGVVYIKDTIVGHPYATAVIVTATAGTAAYCKFRPLTEEEQQKKAIEEAKIRAELRKAREIEQEDIFAADYRTCLNRHAYDNGSCNDKIKRCHSPARNLAMLNKQREEGITNAYRKHQP
ncbi:hypothetical protein JST99_01595 [Candidatus Dependentiae bacterium]|nr:hypothetical protein [Candidatus Dependentiae bacterium]